jgi:hypothetical protein
VKLLDGNGKIISWKYINKTSNTKVFYRRFRAAFEIDLKNQKPLILFSKSVYPLEQNVQYWKHLTTCRSKSNNLSEVIIKETKRKNISRLGKLKDIMAIHIYAGKD